jgi:hypothetical protein
MYANCPKCWGPMSTGSKCPNCDPVTVTITPNITYTWVCPKCGSHCSMYGFCSHCGGWAASPSPPSVPTGWKCPGCSRFHGPHVDTCPFCQPVRVTLWSPTYVDPYVYVNPPNITVTVTTMASGKVYGLS